jgi:hypothetical protein
MTVPDTSLAGGAVAAGPLLILNYFIAGFSVPIAIFVGSSRAAFAIGA